MINSIKGSRTIKETLTFCSLRLNDVFVISKESRLSRMMLGVRRLIVV